jgi:tRNA-dihydrouridine synthase B
MLRIGSLQLKNRLIMAPMAGITNLPFRMMLKKMGAGLVTTEMISAKGLVLGKKRTLAYLESDISEKPLSVQIFGSEPESMADAARIAIDRGADMIDINMGCPVRKVVKTGAGAALLRTAERARAVLSAVRKACPVPLTAKIRSGWRSDSPDTLYIARLIEDTGADALILHPRFASQGYSGKADWGLIRKVKDALRIPVIGNGDVFEPSLALKMRDETGCDGVMIGRGAVGNPWIFKQIIALEAGLPPQSPTPAERKAFIMEHFHHLCRLKGERAAARMMRGLLIRYSKGLPHSSEFRGDVTRIKDFDSLVSTMDAFFSSPEEIES